MALFQVSYGIRFRAEPAYDSDLYYGQPHSEKASLENRLLIRHQIPVHNHKYIFAGHYGISHSSQRTRTARHSHLQALLYNFQRAFIVIMFIHQ